MNHEFLCVMLAGVERLVLRWAPLVWLSPGERFMPAGVEDFLQHVTPRAMGSAGPSGGGGWRHRLARGGAGADGAAASIPQGPRSATWYLVSNASVGECHVPCTLPPPLTSK